jgi:hypothetical protein
MFSKWKCYHPRQLDKIYLKKSIKKLKYILDLMANAKIVKKT